MARCGAAAWWLLAAACLLASTTSAPTYPAPLLDDVMESLFSVLRFLLDHPPDLIADTVFGVVIAKGQLKIIEQVVPKYPDKFIFQPSRRVYVLLATKILEKMCEEIATVAPSEPPPNATGYKIIMDKLLRFSLWEFHKPMKRNTLLGTAVYRHTKDPLANMSHDQSLTLEQYRTVVKTGSPDELDSDRCIVELVSNSSCAPSQECRQIETGGQRPTGYSTTHRLLYLQIARQIGCGNSPYFMDVDSRIMDLCAAILKEAEFIARLDVPALLQDLFIEQITLCGIEGFAEFVRPEWIRKILSMQRPEGCYGDVAKLRTQSQRRVKRNDVTTAYGCLMHATGLAASALAVSARALVEMHGV